jgi:transcriptional regulator with XRE-family HTH domain
MDVSALKIPKSHDKTRVSIGAGLRRLRTERRWTQADLGKRLAISQPHLSQIEHGRRSLTAEQFLTILELFNATVSDFVPESASDEEPKLQNALARLGAAHLHESSEVLPRRELLDVGTAVRQTLVDGGPRLLAALAPVVVENLERLNLPRLEASLVDVGLRRRLLWLVENIVRALESELSTLRSRTQGKPYRRALLVLQTFLDASRARETGGASEAPMPDILDREIRSKRTLEEVRTQGSDISTRWGIVSRLKPSDFADALRTSRVGD